ncbi:unnamed protein product, partial [Ectocarpus sp. 8 AP-2014]
CHGQGALPYRQLLQLAGSSREGVGLQDKPGLSHGLPGLRRTAGHACHRDGDGPPGLFLGNGLVCIAHAQLVQAGRANALRAAPGGLEHSRRLE